MEQLSELTDSTIPETEEKGLEIRRGQAVQEEQSALYWGWG